MKRQFLALVAGLALIGAPSLTMMASAHAGGGLMDGPPIEKLAKKFNLSDSQKTQLQSLRDRTQARVKSILTPEQQSKLETAKAEWEKRRAAGEKPQRSGKMRGERGQRRGPGELMASLNLTDTQKSQLKIIREESKTEMEAILKPEQRQQMQQMRQKMMQRFGR
jgi:periplasmic protein CpxP/Spy